MKDRRGNEPGDERRDTRHAGRPPLTFLAHAGHLLRPPRYTRFPSDGREKNRVKGRSDSEPDEPRPSPPPHVLPFVHSVLRPSFPSVTP